MFEPEADAEPVYYESTEPSPAEKSLMEACECLARALREGYDPDGAVFWAEGQGYRLARVTDWTIARPHLPIVELPR